MPLLIVAGKEYGCGSSRDWAAKGPLLLGVRAVLAESYERIHRSNLIGMGVLPLQFRPGETLATFGLTGRETFDVTVSPTGWRRAKQIVVRARREYWRRGRVQRDRPAGEPGRVGLLPERRHPPDGPAEDAGGVRNRQDRSRPSRP